MGGFKKYLFIVCVYVTVYKVSGDVTPACDDGWVANDIYCYYFNNGDNRTWGHAIDECEVKQSQLLRIESVDELNFLKTTFQGYPSYEYWTSLNELQPDGDGGTGTWLWESDEYPSDDVIKWDTEPDNSDDEDCGAINIQATFSDQKCSVKFPYICESDYKDDVGCPPFWLQGQQDCFYVSNSSDPSQVATWAQAKKNCSGINFFGDASVYTHLLTFDVEGDTDFLSKSLPQWQKTTTLFWTGLNDIAQEGKWAWDSKVAFDPSLVKWTQEPNHLAGEEHCAVITKEGTFADRNCNSARNFVCRKPQDFMTDTSDLGCGEWTRAGHKCYKFYSKPKSTWIVARQTCQKLGGDLMKLESLDETRYLSMISETPKMASGLYWIGLNDQSKEGTFVWADGSSADSSFLKWSHSPLNVLANQHCAALTKDVTITDKPCSDFQLGYICEKPMDDNENCPDQWTLYNYNCYYISGDLADQVTGTSICKRKHGKLLAVNDKDELQYIATQIQGVTTWPNMWWIGLSDQEIGGSWVYPNEDDNWPGMDGLIPWNQEPNSYGGRDEDCVSVTYSGTLNDAMCTSQRGFVCEKRSTGSTLEFSRWLYFITFTSLCIIFKTNPL
ncbi:C-type mannose receptor 2 [Patella vulgata]|uniref:C-type mannose receptor 2 n=1 Tax=Patella vulgata TaxID=6465 RepID=UPI00217FD35C|nr:C-type mannose receptor 2 [Patella vulgata]